MQQVDDGMNIDFIRNKWMPALKTHKQGKAALRRFNWNENHGNPTVENTKDVEASYCCVGVLYEQLEPAPIITGLMLSIHDSDYLTIYNFDCGECNIMFSAGMIPTTLWQSVVGSKLQQGLFTYLNDEVSFTFDQIYALLDRLTSDESYYNTVIAEQEDVFLRNRKRKFLTELSGNHA